MNNSDMVLQTDQPTRGLVNYRFLLLRRLVQLTIAGLYISAFSWNQNILIGNLSATVFLDALVLADPFAVLQMLLAGIDLDVQVIVGATIILLFYALVVGRAYCSWVCPINILTDIAAWGHRNMPSILRTHKRSINIGKDFRYWVLGLSLVLSALTGVAAFEAVSPVSLLHRGMVYGLGLTGIFILIAVFLYDLLIQKNGFCGHLCPLGAFYSVLTQYSLTRVKYDLDSCSKCMECTAICPEKQVLPMIGKNSSVITNSACTNCGRCIDVCNDNSLKFIFRLDKEDFEGSRKK